MKTILVPLDGSRHAESVLPYAVSLAHASPARLVILSVWESEVNLVQGELDLRAEELCERGLQHLRRYLQTIVDRVTNHVPCVNLEVRSGHPALEIITVARNLGVDLIAMCTRGRRALETERRGSVADKVIRAAPAPVLTVNPRMIEAVADRVSAPIRRILVPLDLSPAAELALDLAHEVAGRLHARIDLVHVLAEGQVEPGGAADELARLRADHYLRRHQAAHAQAVASFQVTQGRPAPEILRLAEKLGSDLIVMTSRGPGGGGLWPLGSVADEVIDGPVPAIIVPLPRP